MKKFLSRIKASFGGDSLKENESEDEEYVEIDTLGGDEVKSKVLIHPFTISDFSDVKPILDTLRAGATICLVNIKPLKDKDLVELKRAINKLKKTADAIDGDIAGFGDDWIVVTPSFAHIKREAGTQTLKAPE
ncbi:MAG: cell division protein SepF [archaeon]